MTQKKIRKFLSDKHEHVHGILHKLKYKKITDSAIYYSEEEVLKLVSKITGKPVIDMDDPKLV